MLCHKAQFVLKTVRPAPKPTAAQHNKAMMTLLGNVERDDNWNDNMHIDYKRVHSKKRRAQQQFARPTSKKPKIAAKIVTRNHISNARKLELLKQFDDLAPNYPTMIAALTVLHKSNPAIPLNTLKDMLRRRKSITEACAEKASREATRSISWLQKQQTGKFPAEEEIVYAAFLQERIAAKQVTSTWFHITMKAALKKNKPAGWEEFKDSEGWRQKFFDRHLIVFRDTTNTKALTIAERLPVCVKFYQYFMKVCQEAPLHTPFYGHSLARRIHLDEVPFELGGVLKRTAAVRGDRRVQVKSPKIKIEARSASLMLSFAADGRLGPIAVCIAATPSTNADGVRQPRTPKMKKIRDQLDALRSAHPRILLYCQRKAYFDNVTFEAFMEDMLPEFNQQPCVIVMDNLGGHCTKTIRSLLADANADVVFTPPNCTDLVAVTDAGLGRSFKLLMKRSFLEDFQSRHDIWRDGLVTAEDRRNLVVKWCDDACVNFAKHNRKQIVNAFRRCGMGGRCDGSDNNLVRIEGYDGDIEF